MNIYSEIVMWHRFERSCPNMAREAIKFDQSQNFIFSIYTSQLIVSYDAKLKKAVGVSDWNKEIPIFKDETEHRIFLSNALRTMCVCKNISQIEMAERIGVSRSQINRYFNASCPIPSYIAWKMCQEAETLFSDIMAV